MSATGYLRLFHEAGYQVVVSRDLDEDYQGTIAAVLQRGGYYHSIDPYETFVYVTISYGSCGGCDMWEGSDYEPEERLKDAYDIVTGGRKFDSLDDLKEWARNFDHSLQWYGHEENWESFRDRILSLTEYAGFEKPGDFG